jgi:hypothetical protein
MNFIKRILILLALLPAGWGHAQPGVVSTNSAVANRILMVDASSMPVAGGKATLTIGPLRRTNGVYTGSYKLKVFPYFFKNNTGRLAIMVSDEAVADINAGKAIEVIGTATTSNRSGRILHIDATATPVDTNHGNLKLWFLVGGRKMIFQPAYHLADQAEVAGPTPAINTNLAPTGSLVGLQKP